MYGYCRKYQSEVLNDNKISVKLKLITKLLVKFPSLPSRISKNKLIAKIFKKWKELTDDNKDKKFFHAIFILCFFNVAYSIKK